MQSQRKCWWLMISGSCQTVTQQARGGCARVVTAEAWGGAGDAYLCVL